MTANATDVTFTARRRQRAGLRAFVALLASIPRETQAHFARVRNATSLQAQFANLPDEAPADLGMSAEDILGQGAYSEALPFFMQQARGKRD